MNRNLLAGLFVAVVSIGAALAFAMTATAADPPKDKDRYAVVNGQGTVVNVIKWDGKATYAAGKDLGLTPFDPAVHKFLPTIGPTATPTPTAEPIATTAVPLTTEERLARLEADVAAIKVQLGLK